MKFLFFWRNGPGRDGAVGKGCLSQWWPSPFTSAGVQFATAVAGNLAKFSQHPQLCNFLIGTGDRVLAEASPIDRVWGIGLTADDPAATEPARWRGLNLLGFALMRVRAQLSELESRCGDLQAGV